MVASSCSMGISASSIFKWIGSGQFQCCDTAAKESLKKVPTFLRRVPLCSAHTSRRYTSGASLDFFRSLKLHLCIAVPVIPSDANRRKLNLTIHSVNSPMPFRERLGVMLETVVELERVFKIIGCAWLGSLYHTS